MNTKVEMGRPPSDDELAQRWKELYPSTVYSLGCFRRYTDNIWSDVSAIQVKAEVLEILIKAKIEGIRPSKVRINSVAEMSRLICFSLPPSNRDYGVHEFLESCCEIGTECETEPARFYFAYIQWAVLNGHGYKSEDDLAMDLVQGGFTSKNVGGQAYWVGIALKPKLGPEQP